MAASTNHNEELVLTDWHESKPMNVYFKAQGIEFWQKPLSRPVLPFMSSLTEFFVLQRLNCIAWLSSLYRFCTLTI